MIAYANILIPLPLSHPVFTYKIEGEEVELWEKLIGMMAEVPFGKGKTYTGVILSISSEPDRTKAIRYKKVCKLLPYPPIPSQILKLWHWASDYYMCSLGDIFGAAVPSALRPDGKQGKDSPKPARTIKGWVPSKRFLESETWQASLFMMMKRKPAVTKAMNRLVSEFETTHKQPLSLTELAEWLEVSDSVVRQLRAHNILEEKTVLATEQIEVGKLDISTEDTLSDKIRFGTQNILLVHAENSSIRERIPTAYMKKAIDAEQQVLLLFPNVDELSLTLPMLQEAFGNTVMCYHSEVPSSKREENWLAALKGRAGIYVGLRAAVWLPLSRLGLTVVIDEEDKGYRQYEPAPRFTATNLALMLGHYNRAKSLLISSTPSVESYMNAIRKKYAFVSTPHPPKEVTTETVWMPQAYERQRVQGRMLSFELMGAIRESLEEQGVALLLYQRKGYAKRATCKACGESPKCSKCHTIYRYFQESNSLVCGMCGHHEPLPSLCPDCHKPELVLEGTGIERLYSALQQMYRGVNIYMDHELPKGGSKSPAPQIILSTSYDPPVSLLSKATTIGVIQLDLLTTFPDFRSNEYAYRFLTKCRDEAPNLKRMVIQHFIEKQNALTAFIDNDYRILLDHELEERHTILFPPFSRHIDIFFESAAQKEAYRIALHAQNILMQSLPDCSIMGPAPLPIHKRNRDIGYKLTLLSPLNRSTKELRQVLRGIINPIFDNYRGPQLYIYYDVDPL